jgi:lipoprotein-releasing system permease protein
MIFDAVERMVAFRYLRARRQERFVSIIAIFSFLGIALGVAALIVTMSVMNGFTTDLLGRILGFGGHLTVEAPDGGALADFDALADKIKRVYRVDAVRPVVEGQVLASAGGRATGATVRGLRESDLAAQSLIAGRLPGGAIEGFADDKLLIGSRLAYSLGLRPGDRITLTVPTVRPNGLAAPRAQSFEIAATFSVNLPDYDGAYIFMQLPAAQAYFGFPDAVTGLEILVRDPYDVAQDKPRIETGLGGKLRVSTWQETNAALFGALKVERSVMFFILSLIVLVAAFNIICSMIMLVQEKGQDIAILRTMGATRGMVLRVFMLSGASIGVVGTIAGALLGVACAANIKGIQALIGSEGLAFFSRVPALIDAAQVGWVLAMAFALSFLATIYPSWRAARLDPVEALRYE